jgi:DNA polymerase III alpha subunit (gram-positive type)
MKINTEKLFLRDLFLYDVASCHYNILKGLGVDLAGIDPKDKTSRNIKIGLLMKNNPNLTSVLRTVTASTIDEYLTRNNIKPEEVIIRQYDGLIVTKPLVNTGEFLPLELRGIIQTFLSSFGKDKFIALYQNGNISIKGVPQRYDLIDEIFTKILKIEHLLFCLIEVPLESHPSSKPSIDFVVGAAFPCLGNLLDYVGRLHVFSLVHAVHF